MTSETHRERRGRVVLLVGCVAVVGYSLAVFVAQFLSMAGVTEIFSVAVITESIRGVHAAASWTAVACTAIAARSCAGRRRAAWAWLCAGTTAWTLGVTWRVVNEVILNQPVERSEPMLVPLLLFPFAAIGLITHPAAGATRWPERWRMLLDATTLSVAMLLAAESAGPSWRHSEGYFEWMFNAPYPISEVLLGGTVLTLLIYGIGNPHRHLVRVIVCLAVATGIEAVWHFVAAVSGVTTDPPTPLWGVALLALATAALADRDLHSYAEPAQTPSREWLPYAVAAGATAVVAGRLVDDWSKPEARRMLLPFAGIAAIALLGYARQYFLLVENRRLLSEVSRGREQVRRSGMVDQRTGLPNLAGYLELLTSAIEARASGDRRGQPLAVIELRPNSPELIAPLGSLELDAAVIDLARVVAAGLGPDDALARTGEATLAIVAGRDDDGAIELAREIMINVEASPKRPYFSVAAGVAVVRSADEHRMPSAAELTQRAAIALGTVTAVPSGIALFDFRMLRDHSTRFKLREGIVKALTAQPVTEIENRYEPVVALASDRLVGIAVRAGWHDSEGRTVPAGRLIALAREVGLAERVDDVTVPAAISTFSGWRERWPEACKELWVTVCAETLGDHRFPDRLARQLDDAAVPASTIVLEPLDDLLHAPNGREARATLRRVKDMGVRVAVGNPMALADGGLGQRVGQTIDALNRPATDQAKSPGEPDDLDRDADYFGISPVLVERCVEDMRARRLIQATVEFASSRGSATAARQVSMVAQADELFELGCSLARGPLYGESQPADSMEEYIAAAAEGWRTTLRGEASRRRSSQAWRELRQFIGGLPIAAFACDARGDLILAEGALLRQLGITDGSSDRFPLELTGDADQAPGTARFGDALRTALAGEPEVVTVVANGHWLQVHLLPQTSEHERGVSGVLGVAIDVTHRHQAERALRESEERFRAIFDQAPVGIAIIDPAGWLVQTNPALAAMLGRTTQELAGFEIRQLWHAEGPRDHANLFAALRDGHINMYRDELPYRHRDGSPVWVRVTVTHFTGPGNTTAMLALIEDLREVKQLEHELRQAQKLEAVGMLAAGIAHEINTPIQFIGDNVHFLSNAFAQLTRVLNTATRTDDAGREEELERLSREIDLPWLLEEAPGAAQQSLEGVERVATIVRAMKNFGHPDLRDPAPVDINAIVRDTAAVTRNEYKYVADLDLALGDVPPIMGYPSEFHQVVLNLVVNASHAISDKISGSDGRGRITIRTWSDENMAHLAVEDDGCGMTKETMDRIFNPFFTTKEVGRGTGQGLTTVYHVVVEKHGGTVEVDSVPGQGSVFTVRLPRSAAAARRQYTAARPSELTEIVGVASHS